eukprot:9482853-Pyramimonas_sp.AAC.1
MICSRALCRWARIVVPTPSATTPPGRRRVPRFARGKTLQRHPGAWASLPGVARGAPGPGCPELFAPFWSPWGPPGLVG